jgi:flagellin-like protein
MQRRIVKDEQAVSPVIAVILMVAITVVLAAVLYVWAMSFLDPTTKSAPTGSLMASEDGSGVWTVQIVKISPQPSINSVKWYLLDVQGNTAVDGVVSEIYGFKSGEGKGVVFVDNDFNGDLSPGDKFEIYPGEADSQLENVADVNDYSFRLQYEPTGDLIGFDVSFE